MATSNNSNRNSNNAPANWIQNTVAPDAPMLFTGNLGGDPEKDTTRGGTDLAKFSLATERYDFQKKERVTVWINVKVFGAQIPAILGNLRKGSKVQVLAEAVEAYANLAGDKHDVMFSVAARRVNFLSNYGSGEGGGNGRNNHDENSYGDNSNYDTSDVPGWPGDQLSDIPF